MPRREIYTGTRPFSQSGLEGVKIWRVTLYHPATGMKDSTLHSGNTRSEAVGKALQYVPSSASSAPRPKVRWAVVEDTYTGNPNDLVILFLPYGLTGELTIDRMNCL